MEEEKKEKGFVIKDRRLFDDSGSIRSEEVNKAEEKKKQLISFIKTIRKVISDRKREFWKYEVRKA